MDKTLYSHHQVRFAITGPSEGGKNYFLTKSILNILNEFEKIYIYSPSLNLDSYQKLIKCFSDYIPINKIPSILNEGDIGLVNSEIVKDKEFETSDTEMKTQNSKEELKHPQGYEDGNIIILGDTNEKELNDPRLQAKFKRSKAKKLSVFIIGPDYYELPKRTIRPGKNNHTFKPNNFRDVQTLYQNKASRDMALDDFIFLTSTCWNESYQLLTIDMTKVRKTGRYRLGLNSLFVPDTNDHGMNHEDHAKKHGRHPVIMA